MIVTRERHLIYVKEFNTHKLIDGALTYIPAGCTRFGCAGTTEWLRRSPTYRKNSTDRNLWMTVAVCEFHAKVFYGNNWTKNKTPVLIVIGDEVKPIGYNPWGDNEKVEDSGAHISNDPKAFDLNHSNVLNPRVLPDRDGGSGDIG